jgi:hypothetical protein
VVRWWSDGGQMVVRWWSDGGQMVVRWWSDGGQMVVRWWSDGDLIYYKHNQGIIFDPCFSIFYILR